MAVPIRTACSALCAGLVTALLTTVPAQADALRNSGHADSERELQALQAEVTRLTRRRDSITAQLSALRDVVAGFGNDDES